MPVEQHYITLKVELYKSINAGDADISMNIPARF